MASACASARRRAAAMRSWGENWEVERGSVPTVVTRMRVKRGMMVEDWGREERRAVVRGSRAVLLLGTMKPILRQVARLGRGGGMLFGWWVRLKERNGKGVGEGEWEV